MSKEHPFSSAIGKINFLIDISRLSLLSLVAASVIGAIINIYISSYSIHSPLISVMAISMFVLFLLFVIGSFIVSLYASYLVFNNKPGTKLTHMIWIWIFPFLSAIFFYSFYKKLGYKKFT